MAYMIIGLIRGPGFSMVYYEIIEYIIVHSSIVSWNIIRLIGDPCFGVPRTLSPIGDSWGRLGGAAWAHWGLQ